ncbi:M23 family metallopeptidase [Streptomyces sp. NPDC090303]|uniref:M23 family metallopeptidase n=1 Tax=Streptomyces sp. NPDC090303 TaxID=3365960 RepID=UPI00380350D0
MTYAYGSHNPRYTAGYHTGDDYAAPLGTPVVATDSGVVEWANTRGGPYGTWLGLRRDNGRLLVYCHLSRYSVTPGTRVSKGQVIGRVGATGRVSGPHLHIEDHPPGRFRYGHGRKPSW